MLTNLDPAQLFAPVANEETIGLAISGGADSLALMLLYAAWDDPRKPNPIVYTLDHGLRPEAGDEAEMVVREAGRLGLDARRLSWTGTKPSTGKQEAARAARYRLIGEAMEADGVKVLVTAHHRRDQAETVLMRLAHGSGVSGLGAMRVFALVEGVKIFRPLLDTPPEALADLVARAALTPAADPSNGNPAYERTRWRNMLPGLADLGLTEDRLAVVARRMQRIDALAERLVDDFVSTHFTLDPLGVVRCPRSALAAAEPEIAVRALGRALDAASGTRPASLARIEALAQRIAVGDPFAATLAGARVDARGDTAMLFREVGRIGLPEVRLGAGETALWDGRFSIEASVPLTITPAIEMTRERFARLNGAPLSGPVAALRSAPLICDEAGCVLALGALVFEPGVAVRQVALTAWRSNCGKGPPEGPAALVSRQ